MELFCSNDLVESFKIGTANQVKIFYNLIYQWRWQEKDKFEIEIPKLKRMTQYRNFTYGEMEEINSCVIDRIILRNGESKIKSVPLFGEMQVDKETKIMQIEVTNAAKIYFENKQDNFTKIDLFEINKMNSKTSMRLLEFIMLNANIKTRKINIDKFKLFMGQPKACDSSLFLKKVKKALDLINEKTKFKVTMKSSKKNLKINTITFLITKSKTMSFKEFALRTSQDVGYIKYYLDTYKEVHGKAHRNYTFEEWERYTSEIDMFTENCIQDVYLELEKIIQEHISYPYKYAGTHYLHNFTGENKDNRAYEVARKYGIV